MRLTSTEAGFLDSRAISDQSDGAAKCALLQRSVRFAHKRLADG
jgi:hypothetical protein